MRRAIFFLLSTLALAAMAQTAPQLQVRELTLANGMTVWLNEDHTQPKVFGAVVVRAGAKDCPNTGIAHYFEHIMFKGTDRLGTTDYEAERPWLDSISVQYDLLAQTADAVRRTQIQQHINELSLRAADYAIPNEFNRLISRYGGSGLNAATSFDMTFYYNTFAPQFVRQWCWLNSERLLKPVFRGFQAELENVYEEKNRAADGLGDVLERVQRAVFKEQPYAYPIIGSTESLKNPRLSDMEAFYKKYYVAPNMGLILCGDIAVDSVLTQLLEQTFGRVQGGPVPQRTPSPMPAIAAGEQTDVRLPIPLVKAEGWVYQAPTEYEPDAVALELANLILSNDKAGMLDSLVNSHVLMAAGAQSLSLADAGCTALYMVPKIPFGKMRKAGAACQAQLERLMRGDFSDEQLEALKREMLLEAERNMETIGSRAQLMIEAFSQGRTWPDVLERLERIRRLTRQDVVQAAQRYYGANHITLTKKFGMGNKETLAQPGYKPVEPKNADRQSEFARWLEQLPAPADSVRLLDFDRDATTQALNAHATLYHKVNPVNDIFSLALRYRDGQLHTPMLEVLADYLGQVGTDSLTKQQLGLAWQRMGVTMDVESGEQSFLFTLTGPDSQLQPAVQLLAHFLRAARADKEALGNVKQSRKVEDKAFGKQKDGVLEAVGEWLAYGQRSNFLTRLSSARVKALTADSLLQALADVQDYDCDLFYCGRQSVARVASLLQQSLPLARCRLPQADTYRPLQAVPDEPLVYFYHVPKSRQNLVASYELLPAGATPRERAVQRLWARYFGGGMSSVLFQNVREFRSLAYATQGYTYAPSLALHPDAPLAYATMTGTQADKTLQALAVVDSLLHHLPMKEANLTAARQELLSAMNNNYPDFRHVAFAIANHRRDGYSHDPNQELSGLTATLSPAQLAAYHEANISGNRRVWVVIGDRKLTDLNALSRYGKVVELKQSDIYK